jgi:hypothetical protein
MFFTPMSLFLFCEWQSGYAPFLVLLYSVSAHDDQT